MEKNIVERLTGMSKREIRECDFSSPTPDSQFIEPHRFITPKEREARREEIRNQPTPSALQPTK